MPFALYVVYNQVKNKLRFSSATSLPNDGIHPKNGRLDNFSLAGHWSFPLEKWRCISTCQKRPYKKLCETYMQILSICLQSFTSFSNAEKLVKWFAECVASFQCFMQKFHVLVMNYLLEKPPQWGNEVLNGKLESQFISIKLIFWFLSTPKYHLQIEFRGFICYTVHYDKRRASAVE